MRLARSASQVWKGSTGVGHAFAKHANSVGKRAINARIWGGIRGDKGTYHAQGMKHFRDILRGPGKFRVKPNEKGIRFLEKRLPDGRGMRLNMDGTFKGFILMNDVYELLFEDIDLQYAHSLLSLVDSDSNIWAEFLAITSVTTPEC